MKKIGGLRKRWLFNTAGLVLVLGLICVIAVTIAFSAYYYSNMEADLEYRAKTTTDFFSNYINQNYKEFYQSCIYYANNFEDRNTLELQFIDARGRLVASSYGNWVLESPNTPEIVQAIATRGIRTYRGVDSQTGERIIAVSSAMIYSNGEVIGVLRYVTSTRLVDWQIFVVFSFAMGMLLLVMLVVLLSGNYYVRSILIPVNEITEKAKRITSGSYGIQIESKYNDEIGDLVETINEMSVQINQNEIIQRDFIYLPL